MPRMDTTDCNNKFEGPTQLFQSYLSSVPASIGVFWDIENCSIPFHKSALGFVQKIRDRFFVSRKEVEFMCVCDTSNQNRDTIQELNDAQVTVVHISAVSKNTADDKIRQSLRRFAADHKSPADIILISGDVNFASDLSDLRYRHHIHIILIHRRQVAIALTSCAHESYCFEDFLEDLPTRTLPQTPEVTRELTVTNLPVGIGVQNSLQRLCKSVRGRIIKIEGTVAVIRFPSNEATLRAQKRLDGENLMGRRIKVTFPKKETRSSWVKQDQPERLSNGQESFQVAYSIAKFKENAASEVMKADQKLPNLHGDMSYTQNGADRTATGDKHETKKSTSGVESKEIAQQPSIVCWPSADVMAGDIVIEGEEEEEENEEEEVDEKGAGDEGNVLLEVDSLLADKKSGSVDDDDGVGGVVDVDTRPTELKTEEAAVKQSEKSKRKRRQKCKASSDENSQKSCSHVEKLQGDDMEKMQWPTSVPFVDISHQRENPNVTLSSSVKVANDKTNNDGRHFSNWPSAALLKNIGSEVDCISVSRAGTYSSQSHWHGRDDVSSFLRDWQCASRTDKIEQCQLKALTFQPPDLQQHYNACNETYEIQRCNPFVPNVGEKERFNELRTSALWKPSHSDRFSCENANPSLTFRRTPGARRPKDNREAKVGGSRANQNHSVSSAPEKRLPGAPYFGVPVSGGSDNGLVTKDVLRRSDEIGPSPVGISVIVSNLDYNISANEWKKILADEFRQHVQVVGVHMQTLQDNTSVAYVRVSCVEDARCAISHLHRKKIGYKRIHVALVTSESPLTVASVRAEVVGLLQEVSNRQLPLFQFIELFEKRFQRRISVSELYQMKDTVDITEQEGTGRTVVLLPIPKDSSAATSARFIEESAPKHLESSVCRMHQCRAASNFANSVDVYDLPHVILQLRSFSAQVHKLLQSHDGTLPLVSFPSCFSAEFGELKPVADGSIPLEHLITCVPGVQISLSEAGIKSVQWAENISSPCNDNFRQSCSSPGNGHQISQFVHELIDLLRNCSQCRVPFSKFIPAYHHHFGRQLRVADYGCTKLMELFEKVPHVAQVIGYGCQKYVMLTHKAQVKRFTGDLLRILKSQSSKQISVVELPAVYNKAIGRAFDITEYGICFLEDLVSELPDSSFTIFGTGVDMVIALPKREQTPEEMEKTKQFAREAVDLLRHSPRCRMSFSKFIPAYHHHFGKQCRVADYGFTKLMELFEAIPDIIKIHDRHDEKILCLTEQELVHIMEDQVASLLHSCPCNRIAVSEFHAAYLKAFGHPLQLGDFEVKSVVNLIRKIPSVAEVLVEDGRSFVCLVNRTEVQLLARNVLLVLMDLTEGSILLEPLMDFYQQHFGSSLDVNTLTSDLQGIVEVTVSEEKRLVKLTPLQMFARDVRTLLFMSNGQLHVNQFERNYSQHYGVKLSPASYGFPNVLALVQAVPHVVALKGKGSRHVLHLMKQFREKLVHCSPTLEPVGDLSVGTTSKNSGKSDSPSSDSGYAGPKDALLTIDDQELVLTMPIPLSAADLLSVPVPSCVPSPDLLPQPNRPPSNLMRFDLLPHKSGLDFLMLSEDEKFGLVTPLCRTPVSDMLAFAAQLLPTEIRRKSMKENSSEDNESVLLSITLQKELEAEQLSADRKSSNCRELAECSVENAAEVRENENPSEVITAEEKEANTADDDLGDISHLDHLNNLDLSGEHVNDKSVDNAMLDRSCNDDLSYPHGLGMPEEQDHTTGLKIVPINIRDVNSSKAESEEILPQNVGLSSPKAEQFSVSFKSASKVPQKQDSARRSRIAARFDVSPIPSNFTSCLD